MGRYGMTPDDFAECARIIARGATGEVAAMQAKLGTLLAQHAKGGGSKS
jgi:hypothetical protein